MRDWSPFLGLPLWVWLFVFPTILCLLVLMKPQPMARVLAPIWSILDRVYKGFGVLAACFLVTILLLIVAQMIARWTGIQFSGSTEFAGYAMAATSFFAMAHALTHGAHIRVSIFLNLNDTLKFWLDALAMLISACIATYFARYAIKTNQFSVMLNDRTQGQDQVPEWALSVFRMFKTSPSDWGTLWANTPDKWVFTPVWLPQLAMSVGTVILAIAIWDYLTRLLAQGETQIVSEGVE